MKRVLALVMIVLSFTITAQEDNKSGEFISFSIHQDVNLALFEKDNGLTPFTLDMQIRMKWAGNEYWDLGYFSINTFYEYAELSESWKGNFNRYGVDLGFTFAYCELFNKKFEITPLLGYGFVGRENDGSTSSFSANIEVSFKIFNNIPLRVNLLGGYMSRPDLDNKFYKNGYAGIEYRFYL